MQGIPHTSKILFWIMFHNEIDLSLAKPPIQALIWLQNIGWN